LSHSTLCPLLLTHALTSLHNVFHINLLTPYHETAIHRPNYSRPPPDLVDNAEEYKVEKVLDSWHFSRRCKLQYLIKWKGYPDSDNKWVDKNDVHASKVIREFKNQNPASETHINTSCTSNFLIPSPHPTCTFTCSTPMLHVYYTQSPATIFTAELAKGLISYEEAANLCVQ